MTREMLYDAITEVKDELVLDSMAFRPAKKRVQWMRFGAIAAVLAVVIGLGAGVFSGTIPWLIGGNAGGGGTDGSQVFDIYAGPVFPLTTVEGGEGLTAERTITYDFKGWMAGDPDHPYYGLPVTDSYALTNPTVEDKTVTLLYPFAAYPYELERYQPTLTIDGIEADAALLTGKYSELGSPGRPGGLPSLDDPESWDDYRTLLSDGRYQASATGSWPNLSHVPVTVYEVTNPWVEASAGNKGDDNYNPNIHAEMELDYSKTTVLSCGFNSYCHDPDGGTARFGFDAPQPPTEGSSTDPGFYEWERKQCHYLIVMGEPLDNFRLVGVSTGGPESTDYLEWDTEIGADLRQYETNLESALCTAAEPLYYGRDWDGIADNVETPSEFELYFGLLKDCLLDAGLMLSAPEVQYDLFYQLENVEVWAYQRVFYLEAEVTIPAGGSFTVETQMFKKPSQNHQCHSRRDRDLYGYDLVTRLGSNLSFTVQTAKAVNTEGVEIVRQNFGFDWENDVDTVELDLDQEHYYLELRRNKAT